MIAPGILAQKIIIRKKESKQEEEEEKKHKCLACNIISGMK